MDWVFYSRQKRPAHLKERLVVVPKALSFDKVIAGSTCSPCSTRDFLNYLRFVEHSPETLRFFLWHRDYTNKFNSLSREDQDLSPPWELNVPDTLEKAHTHISHASASTSGRKHSSFLPGNSIGTIDEKLRQNSVVTVSHHEVTPLPPIGSSASFQPFRNEVSLVAQLYISAQSPYELNLTSRERLAVLEALAHTTHPSAFDPAVNSVLESLRYQSHPNFVQHSLSNAGRARIRAIRLLAGLVLLSSIVFGLLLTLSRQARWWRLFGVVPFVLGLFAMLNASKGICFWLVYLGFKREMLPWELFPADEVNSFFSGMSKSEHDSSEAEEYGIEEWVENYENNTTLLRRMYERRTEVEEKEVKRVQRVISKQSFVVSCVVGLAYIGIFIGLPRGNLF
ncbi:hypothetical protein TWF569_010247 [Orbilia oligospora]|uniref:RGS domain-containing protein n=1 Tax=Orbilia oligospora TaxID=2813651 RepID=A0A7C8PDE7_ORBOL|nr:hypothetical protein TWF706_004317 [Orbilia oligospora]KAF3112771.1 hypothetical protein TWF102_004167 [Orbilia oligospora]KAF3117697.1 hypothetical protein TWF103_004378 [Orbilia oligospora]KAF3134367.1 hypothetical protein TWF569_010247 [Orbilia oligospora]KAF3142789.1 hypothetical protein TWF703_000293 [Orbilia oligospora]